MKTLKEIKQEIAYDNGCACWGDLLATFHIGQHESFYDKAAIRYANSKIDEIAQNIDWCNCYEGGDFCATDGYEIFILSFKEPH